MNMLTRASSVILSQLLALLLCFFSNPARAGEPIELEVKRKLKIYREKGKRALLRVLEPGDLLYLSPAKYGKWRKVLLLNEDDSQEIGWLPRRTLKGRVRRVTEEMIQAEETEQKKKYYGSTGVGLSLTSSYMLWGQRSFETSDDSTWDIEEASSFTNFVSAFIDLKFGKGWVLRPYINLRETEFKGNSTSDFIGTEETNFKQVFQGLGILSKSYFDSRLWWWGVGAEGAQGQKLTIEFSDQAVDTKKEDLSFYIFGFVSLGYDLHVSGDIFFLPEVRAGAVVNQDPYIYFLETHLSIGYRL